MTAQIGITAAGDPRDGKTWSGTPKALVNAAEALGKPVVTFSGQHSGKYDNIHYLPTILRHGMGARRFRHYFGPSFRKNVTEYAIRREAYPDIPFLHTDHLWLDPARADRKDFLFRDCGWSSWAQSRGLSVPLTQEIGRRYAALLNRVGHIFTTSEWAKNELIMDGARPEAVTVVGTGVGNLIKPYFGSKDYTSGITLCVAKVRHHDKGIDLLVEGFRLARRQRPELSLHLVVPPNSIKQAPGLHLYSSLPAADLISLYQKAPLFAMPARNEPYGLVYREAQLAGMALLGSARAAFPEFAAHGESGFIVKELTAEAVAQALLDAHGNPDGLRSMGHLGREAAVSATWENTMEAILERMT